MSDETIHNDDELSEVPEMAPKLDVAGTALGALSASDAAAVRSADDPAIAAELAAMDETAAELARLSPLLQINRGRSAGIRSRLLSRAAASREGRLGHARAPSEIVKPSKAKSATIETKPSTRELAAKREPLTRGQEQAKSRPAVTSTVQQSTVPDLQQARLSGRHREAVYNPPSPNGAWRFLAAAAALACVALGTQLYRMTHERNQLRDTLASQDAVVSTKIASLAETMAAKDSLIASLTGPTMRVVDLANYSSHDPLARMFWDRKTQQWTMYAYNLRQPKPGKTYQVWLIASNAPAPISAGTFRPDAHGAAVMRATYPMDRGMLQKVAISEEPDGGMPSPTGPIIIAGAGR